MFYSCYGRHAGLFVTALLLLGLGAPVQADVVHLKNGDRISGSISTISAKRLRIKPAYASAFSIELAEVAGIETDDPFELRIDKERVTGTLGFVDGNQQLLVDAGAEPRVLTSPAVIRRASRNKLAVTALTSDWSSRADLSAAIATGNADTEAYNGLIESNLTRGKSEHTWSLLLAEERADDELTRDVLDVDYRWKRYVNKKLYLAGTGEYFQDQIKDIDFRATAGLGLGYQFWDNSLGAFSTELGATYVVEEIGGEREQNPAFLWGLDFNRFLWGEALELFHKHSLLVIGSRGEVLQTSTGLRVAISDAIDANIRTDVRHETEPVPGNEKTDITYNLGIGIRF